MNVDDAFEAAWSYREESLYPSILKRAGTNDIYLLNDAVFRGRFEQDNVDPRWLHCGVIPFPGNARYPNCGLVTSGLSNAWETMELAPEDISGAGLELRMELAECSRWGVVVLLRLLAQQLLIAFGRLPGSCLKSGDVVGLGGPITDNSQLTHLLVSDTGEASSRLQLPTGRFDLLLLTGITSAEARFAASSGPRDLFERLRGDLDYPLTDPDRKSVV